MDDVHLHKAFMGPPSLCFNEQTSIRRILKWSEKRESGRKNIRKTSWKQVHNWIFLLWLANKEAYLSCCRDLIRVRFGFYFSCILLLVAHFSPSLLSPSQTGKNCTGKGFVCEKNEQTFLSEKDVTIAKRLNCRRVSLPAHHWLVIDRWWIMLLVAVG